MQTNLKLKTRQDGEQVFCELLFNDQLEARGVVRNGLMVGPWATYHPDGSISSQADLSALQSPTELEPVAVREALTLSLMQEWLQHTAGPPKWMEQAGFFTAQWKSLEEPLQTKSLKRLPMLIHGAFCPEPMVRSFCMRALHLSIVDSGEIFPVAPMMTPLLGLMIEQPAAPVAWLAQILVDVTSAVKLMAREAGVDLKSEDSGDELLRPTFRALENVKMRVEMLVTFNAELAESLQPFLSWMK